MKESIVLLNRRKFLKCSIRFKKSTIIEKDTAISKKNLIKMLLSIDPARLDTNHKWLIRKLFNYENNFLRESCCYMKVP